MCGKALEVRNICVQKVGLLGATRLFCSFSQQKDPTRTLRRPNRSARVSSAREAPSPNGIAFRIISLPSFHGFASGVP